MKFYVLMDCQECGADILIGPAMTLLEHNGLPVVPFDMAAQETFRCDECGATHYTSDFDVMVEPGDEEEGES